MNRRDFFLYLGITILGLIIGKAFAFSNNSYRKIRYAIRGVRYPGEIKEISKGKILKEGHWLG